MFLHDLPIHVNSSGISGVGIEPEGDWFPAVVGDRFLIRFMQNADEDPEVELEVKDNMILVYSGTEKQVWNNDVRKR
jgi:hypothetical protein